MMEGLEENCSKREREGEGCGWVGYWGEREGRLPCAPETQIYKVSFHYQHMVRDARRPNICWNPTLSALNCWPCRVNEPSLECSPLLLLAGAWVVCPCWGVGRLQVVTRVSVLGRRWWTCLGTLPLLTPPSPANARPRDFCCFKRWEVAASRRLQARSFRA